MPTVSFDRVISGPVSRVYTALNGEVTDYGSNWSSGPMSRYYLQKTWVRTPGFRAGLKNNQIRRRDLPMNNYSYHSLRQSFPYGDVTLNTSPPFSDPGGSDVYAGCINLQAPTDVSPSIVGMQAVDFNYLSELAATKTLSGLKDQKVNLVQAFAERGQTVRLIGNTIDKLASAAGALRAGNFTRAAKALGVSTGSLVGRRAARRYRKSWVEDQSSALANGWLELQYGWRPLLSDIYGAAEQLAQTNIREVRNIVRRSAKVDEKQSGVWPGTGYNPAVYYQIVRSSVVKYTVYYSTPVGNHSLTQIGLTNPVLIAWELTPWSFVVDWLLPIGNYLQTLDATSGLVFEKGCRTEFQETTIFAKSMSGDKQPGVNWEAGPVYRLKEIRVLRNVIGDFPRASLPRLKNPFSITHVLNGIALLRTNLRVR